MNNWIKGVDYPEWMTNAGLSIITKGYLLKDETPKHMYQRVAMAAASRLFADEASIKLWFHKFFDYMWKGWLCPASPILANMGTDRGLPISCLVGDSWIHTKNGGGKLIKDIEIGDEVLTHKGRFRKVIGKQKRKSKNDLFLLKVATRSTPIKITGNHPVLTNLGWVRVDELEKNKHLIATNKNIEYQPKDHFIELVNNNISCSTKVNEKVFVDNDLAWAIGLWFAKGLMTKGDNKKPNGIRLTMGIHEKDVIERAVKIFKDKFNVNSNIYESSYEKNKKTARWITANINSTILGEYFCKEFGVGCKNKNVSEWIKNLPKDKLMSFLQGVMDGNGSKIYSSGKIISNRITLANPKLILSLYEIALKCNYRVSLNFEEKIGKLSSDQFVYSIYIRYSDSMYIKSGIDFGDLIYCPIIKLEKLDINEDVYDITVEEDHSFTVAGIVVHNCFGYDVEDDLFSIGYANLELMMLTKYGGGVGINLNKIRGRGMPIRNNGFSEGIVPWAKIYDSTIIASNQGSTRKGAASLNLYIDHIDIEEFLRIRRPTGDINRQCLNINHCVLITDDFMKKVENGDKKARDLFKEVLKTRMETGEPYIMYVDNVNNANPEAYKKNNLSVSLTNLCSEIVLHTDANHGFVCCLSSLNLVEWDKWKDTDLIETITIFLEGVMQEFIDKSQGKKGLERVRLGAIKGRPIGIGVIGWHTLLQKKNLPFNSSPEVMQLNSKIFKTIHDKSKQASELLAKKFGEPEWCKGTGLRHTHRIAIAPTVSNSKIAGGHSPSIEPIAANAFVDKTSKGVFLYKNPQLQELLQKYNKDTQEVWKTIVTEEGSVQHLDFLTEHEKEVFLTAREINQMHLINQAASRGIYIDQAQSLNLFFPANVDPRWLYKIHLEAWKKGLKTLYYLRSSSILKGDVASRFYDDSCVSCEG
jgi:ribonucleoside-diphosphate reductase alpha chain